MKQMRAVGFGLFIGLAAVVVASAATAASKGSFFEPDHPVVALSDGRFEVIETGSDGAKGMWCAAAFHAQFTLGQDSGRLYVARPIGPSPSVAGRQGVVFSTRPVEMTYTGTAITVDQTGANLLMNHAIQFCRDSDLEADQ